MLSRCPQPTPAPIALAIALTLALAGAAPVAAQQPGAPAAPGAAAKQQPSAAPARAPKAAPKSDAAPAAATATGGEGGLRQRVEALEEQLVDLQVTIGTLESLAKSGGGSSAAAQPWRSAPSPAGGGADQSRVNELEMQVRALSSQLEQLTSEVRAAGGRRSAAPPVEPGATVSRFGSTTVTAAGNGPAAPAPSGDPIGGLIERAPLPPPTTPGTPAAADPGQRQAALPPAGDQGNPKQLYEQAYGYLLQQDYGAAEAAFDDFLKRYPSDQLAGNAQYWLGESHFVRGQFKAAAGAFLKGYQTYARSPKAPDSLLKLAISLDRLGQKDAACSSFSELNTKFPAAPAHVKTRADAERKRLGCS